MCKLKKTAVNFPGVCITLCCSRCFSLLKYFAQFFTQSFSCWFLTTEPQEHVGGPRELVTRHRVLGDAMKVFKELCLYSLFLARYESRWPGAEQPEILIADIWKHGWTTTWSQIVDCISKVVAEIKRNLVNSWIKTSLSICCRLSWGTIKHHHISFYPIFCRM